MDHPDTSFVPFYPDGDSLILQSTARTFPSSTLKTSAFKRWGTAFELPAILLQGLAVQSHIHVPPQTVVLNQAYQVSPLKTQDPIDQGRHYGGELTINYSQDGLKAYTNTSYERAVGTTLNSSQFQFNPSDLAYIVGIYIPLDHQQLL